MAASQRSQRKAAKPDATLDWGQVRAFRVRSHRLDRPVPRDAMLDAVGGICGLHAQIMSSAELGLFNRVQELASGDLSEALWVKRSLVKTWAMRGTLHILPAREYGLWQAALATYRHYLKPAWSRYFGVNPAEVQQLLSAIAEGIDKRALTREELASEVARRTGSQVLGEKLRESWGSVLKPAAFQGLICYAPEKNGKVSFTSPRAWLGQIEVTDPEHALQEVTKRYLAAYGPATLDDLSRWWGWTPAQARARIASLGSTAASVDIEGTVGWMLRADIEAATQMRDAKCIRLLPSFDQYTVNMPRSSLGIIEDQFKKQVYRPQGWIYPVVLVDGRITGTWNFERKTGWLDISIQPFEHFTSTLKRGIETEAARLGKFLGTTAVCSWQ